MIFADQKLAQRIECAERELTEAFARARQACGDEVFIVPLAGGSAVFAGSDCPFTKVIGCGFETLESTELLEEVEQRFAGKHCKVGFEVCTLADPALVTLLTGRGYRLAGFENVSAHRLDGEPGEFSQPLSQSSLSVEPVAQDQETLWSKTVTQGFRAPDGEGVAAEDDDFPAAILEQLFCSLGEVSGVHRYLARWNGQVAGGASLRTSGGLAQLSSASVLPAFRRRGIQTAMCRTRLEQARSAGCDLAVVTTSPGSLSQHNVLRQGFELLYSRAMLVKAPPEKS